MKAKQESITYWERVIWDAADEIVNAERVIEAARERRDYAHRMIREWREQA